jgi:hypothetical protein
VTATREGLSDRHFLENLREALRAMAREAVTLSENNPAWDGAIGSVDDMRTLVESAIERTPLHEAASKLAPPAPDDAPRFKVGDDVIVALDENDRERGKVVALLSGDLLVRVGDCRVWRSPSQVTPTDAPDDAVPEWDDFTELDARTLDAIAKRETLTGNDRAVLRNYARSIRTAIANGAGEVERLRAELAEARRTIAFVRKEYAASREALSSYSEDSERERDSLRAELDEARRVRNEKHATLRAVAHELGVCHCWDYGCEPGDHDAIVRRAEELAAAGRDLDEARRERDEERAEHKTTHAMWRGLLTKIEELRAANEALVREGAELAAEATRLRDSNMRLRENLAEMSSEDDARAALHKWFGWCGKHFKGQWKNSEWAREAIDAKLAAAKAGPVATVDDAKAVAFAIGKVWESPYRETLISVCDRLAAFVQARGEMEAGK